MTRPASTRATPRGYALAIVIVTLGLIAVLVAALAFAAAATIDVAGRSYALARVAAASDGVMRTAMLEIDKQLDVAPAMPAAALLANVCAAGGGCTGFPPGPELPGWTPADVTIESFWLQDAPGALAANVSVGTGPFASMRASKRSIEANFRMRDLKKGVALTTAFRFATNRAPAFEFMGLSPLSSTIYPDGLPRTLDAPVHANGGLCLGATDDIVSNASITAAGSLLYASTAGCPAPPGGPANVTFSGVATAFDGATDGASAAWASAGTTFRGRALDGALGVRPIDVAPAAGAPAMQGGAINTTSWRYLVDPARAADSAALQASKLAWQADIRIVNGVWYLRDPSNPALWPGTPIWSDHPGNHVVSAATIEGSLVGTPAVGQADLFGAGARPTLYSQYNFDALGNLVSDGGAVSYGAMVRSGPSLVPANGGSAAAANIASPAQFLNGTRAGFVDAHLDAAALPQKVLPMNFDVAAFLVALASLAPDELGGRIAARVPATPFNGIVYITNTWTGSAGMPFPTPAPAQGALDNVPPQAAPLVVAAAEQPGLPQPLCSVAPVPVLNAAPFVAPACAVFDVLEDGPRPTALRIVNGSSLGAQDLTIATNLEVYVAGNFNAVAPTLAMIAADHVTFLSNGWTDASHTWGVVPYVAGGPVPAAMTVNASLLVGTRASGGFLAFEEVPVGNEPWPAGVPLRLNGSVLLGFASVFRTEPLLAGVSPAQFDWVFDPRLASTATQPPGTPMVTLSTNLHFMR